MSNERQYYEDIGYKPFLFYVVFGVSGDELEVSRSKHNGKTFEVDAEFVNDFENDDYNNAYYNVTVLS